MNLKLTLSQARLLKLILHPDGTLIDPDELKALQDDLRDFLVYCDDIISREWG